VTQTGQKRKYEQAIQALLTTATIGESAAQCGISERTLLRWLAEPEFSEAYQKAKSDLLAAATGKLRFESVKAVDVLATVAGNAEAPASARAGAARAIIQLALDANTAENLEARIAILERTKKP
jgi:hypothetical protein